MTPKKDGNIFKILEIDLNSASVVVVLGLIEQRTDQNRRTFLTTPNPEFIVYAQQHPWFKRLLIQSDIAIPDGVALLWAKEVLRKNNPFSRLLVGFLTGLRVVFTGWGKRRITGTDLMEKLCQLAAKKRWSIYLLGGKEGIAQKTLKVLQAKYGGLKGWANSGPKLEITTEDTSDGGRQSLRGHDSSEVKKWIDQINIKHPDLLFVAFGMGKQEKFIVDHWDQLKIKLGIGIGGAFNYLSGEIKRAPQWVQNMGFEWLYRLCQEPWRWKRQLSLLKFIWLVLRY